MAFSDYLDEQLGETKDIGDQRRYNCPFCEPNNDFKFYVNTTGGERDGLWTCFKCGQRGNAVSFVMKHQGSNFMEAKDTLELYDYEFSDFTRIVRESGVSEEEALIILMNHKPDDKKVEDVTYRPPPLPVGFKRIVDNLDKPWEIKPFVEYLLIKRGFTQDDIYTHNIGYVVRGHVTTQQGKKVPLDNHVIFITHSDDGTYRYWNSRSIEPDPYIKSFNGLAGPDEYSKRNSVFNLNRAKHQKHIYICEGVPDALTMGIGGVATFGKQVTQAQIDLITKDLENKQVIYVTLDMDAKKEMLALAQKLYQVHKNTYIVLNGTDKDPNDLGAEQALAMVQRTAVKADATGEALLLLM